MKKILTLCLIAAIFTGCKKSDDDSSASLAITLQNIAGTYKATGETTTLNGGAATDTYSSSYLACERDDTYTFTAAGNVSFVDAGVQCSPPNASFSSTYSLSGSQITLMGQAGTVESLTSTTLKISSSYTSSGTTVKQTTTYTRQ